MMSVMAQTVRSPMTQWTRHCSTGTLERYSKPFAALHWLSAAGLLATIGAVKTSQFTDKDGTTAGYTKMDLMFLHKSCGLAVTALLVPRIAMRLTARMPGHVGGNITFVEHLAGDTLKVALYSGAIVMASSGIAMGYFGGKGLPFFTTTLPGAVEPKPEVAKNAYSLHKKVGKYFPFVIPVHSGAAILHYFRGHRVFARMNPFW